MTISCRMPVIVLCLTLLGAGATANAQSKASANAQSKASANAQSKASANAQSKTSAAAGKEETPLGADVFPDAEAAFRETMKLLLERHVDGTLTRDELYQAAIEGMLRYSSMEVPGQKRASPSSVSWMLLSPEKQASVAEFGQGSFTGIGCILGPDASTGAIRILEVMAGSPSEKAGLKEGDFILSMNGVQLTAGTWPYSLAYKDQQDKATVKVVIRRGSRESEYTLTREPVRLEAASGELLPQGIGLIRLRYMITDAPQKVQGLLIELKKQGIRGLVLDLRGCSGNNLEIAVQILDLLLPEGKVVLRLEDREGRVETFTSHGVPLLDVPCVLLVSEETDLGGEVVARALRVHVKTPLVGSATRGAFLVTEIVPMSNGFAARLPVRRILPHEGTTWEMLSLAPDTVARSSAEAIQEAYNAPNMEERFRLDPGFEAAVGFFRK